MVLAKIVDLDRYPIDELESEAGRRLVSDCRASLAQLGACDLPGFVRPEIAAVVAGEAEALRQRAYRTETVHDVDFSGLAPAELTAADPRRTQVRSAKLGVALDCIPEASLLRELYEAPELTAFVGAALELAPIYRHADELGALNLMLYDEGDELGWHFDNADFVVTLLLQEPLAGGAFEYVPALRTAGDRNDDGVRRLLAGERDGVRSASSRPGTLALFRGHLSPHRVTPVIGARPRINAVLSYASRPDARLSASVHQIFYGRVSG